MTRTRLAVVLALLFGAVSLFFIPSASSANHAPYPPNNNTKHPEQCDKAIQHHEDEGAKRDQHDAKKDQEQAKKLQEADAKDAKYRQEHNGQDRSPTFRQEEEAKQAKEDQHQAQDDAKKDDKEQREIEKKCASSEHKK